MGGTYKSLGATGESPVIDDPDDGGGLNAALTVEPTGTIRLDFGDRAVRWVRMTAAEAKLFAGALIAKADEATGRIN
jgi:hypothetical protein